VLIYLSSFWYVTDKHFRENVASRTWSFERIEFSIFFFHFLFSFPHSTHTQSYSQLSSQNFCCWFVTVGSWFFSSRRVIVEECKSKSPFPRLKSNCLLYVAFSYYYSCQTIEFRGLVKTRPQNSLQIRIYRSKVNLTIRSKKLRVAICKEFLGKKNFLSYPGSTQTLFQVCYRSVFGSL
jgi:hypothetical protein